MTVNGTQIDSCKFNSTTITDIVCNGTHVWTDPSNISFATTYNILKSGQNYYRQLNCTNKSKYSIEFLTGTIYTTVPSGGSKILQYKIGTSVPSSEVSGSIFKFPIRYLGVLININATYNGTVIESV